MQACDRLNASAAACLFLLHNACFRPPTTHPQYHPVPSPVSLHSVWGRHRTRNMQTYMHMQALLLQMVGGVSQEFPGTGMKLRGDIHVCLMGDPGVCEIVGRRV